MNLKKTSKNILDVFVTTYKEWINDRAFTMAAALSFYSLISLTPFLLIITFSAGLIFGKSAAEGQIVSGVVEDVGPEVADLIQSLILNASLPESGIITIIISSLVFLWASVAVFVQIKNSLNFIWGIEIKPESSLKEFFAGRLFSILILFLVGLLFILTIITGTLVNIAHDFIYNLFGDKFPNLKLIDNIVTISNSTILFLLMFKYLPSVRIEWRYVLTGAVITSVLFNLGKFFIGYYLSRSNYSSVYGTAGSLVVLLFWIYYSSLIFFFGAELIHVIRQKFSGEPLKINKNVLKVMKVSEQIRSAMSKS